MALTRLKNKTKSFCYSLSNILKNRFKRVHVKNIDIINNKVLFLTRLYGRFIHYSVSDVIFDTQLIQSLSSKDAARIGYCYGKLNNHKRNKETFNHFIIISQQNYICEIYGIDRRSNIIFIHREKGLVRKHTFSAADIYEHESLLCSFPPTQSCYIGILAALKERGLISNTKQEGLSLVK